MDMQCMWAGFQSFTKSQKTHSFKAQEVCVFTTEHGIKGKDGMCWILVLLCYDVLTENKSQYLTNRKT